MELQQAREQINVLTQVPSHCWTVVRTLSRDFLNVFPPAPSFPAHSLATLPFFLAVLSVSDTGPFVFFTASPCLCLQSHPTLPVLGLFLLLVLELLVASAELIYYRLHIHYLSYCLIGVIL